MSCPSAEIQSLYSTAPANWVLVQVSISQETVFGQTLLAIHLAIFKIYLDSYGQEREREKKKN